MLPLVHKAISLLKRWLLGYYLDEFVFRFNRRRRSRGKLFYRLVQQAVAVDPTPYRQDWDAESEPKPQNIGVT